MRRKNVMSPYDISNMTTAKTMQLISFVERKPSLWDSNDNEYKNRGLRTRHFNEISAILKIDVESLKRKWENLRTYYLKELKKCKGSIESNWRYFAHMSFLNVLEKPAQTKNEIQDTHSEETPPEDTQLEDTDVDDTEESQSNSSVNQSKSPTNLQRSLSTDEGPLVECNESPSCPSTNVSESSSIRSILLSPPQTFSSFNNGGNVHPTAPFPTILTGSCHSVASDGRGPIPNGISQNERAYTYEMGNLWSSGESGQNSTSITSRKKKLKQLKGANVEAMKILKQCVGAMAGTNCEEHPDSVFGRLIASQISTLPDGYEKEKLKISIQQLIMRVKFRDC